MGTANMLTLTYELDVQPGRIPPTIELKEGSTSVPIVMLVRLVNPDYPDDEVIMETSGVTIVKFTTPEGTEYIHGYNITSLQDGYARVDFYASLVKELSNVPGSFKGTISIIDRDFSDFGSSSSTLLAAYEGLPLVTVQPFLVDVHELAYGHANRGSMTMSALVESFIT